MKKRYFNRKIKHRVKANLRKNGGRKKILSKRFGAVLDASLVLENRNVNAPGLSTQQKEII